MDKSVTSEDLLGKHSNNRTLYEILTIDSELLFLIYLKWDTIILYLRAELLNLWKMCY